MGVLVGRGSWGASQPRSLALSIGAEWLGRLYAAFPALRTLGAQVDGRPVKQASEPHAED